MPSDKNPYRSPDSVRDSGARNDESHASRSHKRAVLSTAFIGALLIMLDFVFDPSQFLVFLGTPALLFTMTVWTYLGPPGHSSKSLSGRVAVAIVVSLLLVPCMTILLVFTCMPATEAVGAFKLHGPRPEFTHRVMGGSVSFFLVWAVSSLTYFLAAAIRKHDQPSGDKG